MDVLCRPPGTAVHLQRQGPRLLRAVNDLRALPGHGSVQERSFLPAMSARIFLSSTAPTGFRQSFPQNTNRGLQGAGCSLFRWICSPAAREASYKGGFGSPLCIPGFPAMQGTMMQFVDPFPSSAGPGRAPQQLCTSSAPAVWVLRGHTRRALCLPCSGSNGRRLLPLLLPHPQSQHGPAVQIWERGKHSGTALGPAPRSTWQPVPSEGCKDAPGSSTVLLWPPCIPPHSRGCSICLHSPHLALQQHLPVPMSPHQAPHGQVSLHSSWPTGQEARPLMLSAKSVLRNTNQMCLRPPHAAAQEKVPVT